jgi:hypothetical protein
MGGHRGGGRSASPHRLVTSTCRFRTTTHHRQFNGAVDVLHNPGSARLHVSVNGLVTRARQLRKKLLRMDAARHACPAPDVGGGFGMKRWIIPKRFVRLRVRYCGGCRIDRSRRHAGYDLVSDVGFSMPATA